MTTGVNRRDNPDPYICCDHLAGHDGPHGYDASAPTEWWGVEHSCGGVWRSFPTLHWADEPEQGAGPRRAFACDACGRRMAFYSEIDA